MIIAEVSAWSYRSDAYNVHSDEPKRQIYRISGLLEAFVRNVPPVIFTTRISHGVFALADLTFREFGAGPADGADWATSWETS